MPWRLREKGRQLSGATTPSEPEPGDEAAVADAELPTMFVGKILAIGSIPELEAEYHESDMEELFFHLIQQHEDQLAMKAESNS